MEGLKLIAQSTFDRHQQFRPSAGAGPAGEGAYRYNVIEIGAFGQGTSSSSSRNNNNNNITATSASTAAARRQSSGSAQSSASGARHKDGLSKISLNEWMVFEDDLCSFMKKRPIDLAPAASGSGFGGELEKPSKSAAHSSTTHSTAPSKTASMPSSRMTANTITTTATTTVASAGHAGSTADRPKKEAPRRTEEVEAVASLKLVCIPRADIDDDTRNPDASLNTLAIARETFLRLYVDHMDADHCALYYLAREYDGYHEFTDTPKGVVTKFLGTSDFALIWTFNRRTLETRGLFLDRCQRWRSSDSGADAHASNNEGGGSSAPATPVNKTFPQAAAADGGTGSSPATPTSKRWARRQTGTVAASEAWYGLRETLNTYRKYIFAPQVLSFVCCVQMLRSFDDQANGQDLPRLKEVEAGIAAFEPQAEVGGSERASRAGVDSLLLPTQSSSFAIVADPDPYGATTPPGDDEKLLIPTAATKHSTGLTPEKLISQSIAISRVDTSLADKLRHLKIARNILDVIARDTETLTIDVVAPSFLDRYHWAMEGMSEAIPALERHISSLDEYLRFLKGRAERLSALVRSSLHSTVLCLAAAAAARRAPVNTTSQTQSDALSLRCNPSGADSQPDLDFGPARHYPDDLGGHPPVAARHVSEVRGDCVGSPAAAVVAASSGHSGRYGGVARDGDRRDSAVGWAAERQPAKPRAGNRGFYSGYILRGNYSHRLA